MAPASQPGGFEPLRATRNRTHLRLVSPDETAQPPRPRRYPLRAAIAAVGLAQTVLGVAQLAGLSFVDVINGGHLGEESAAWNVALGAAFLGVARARRCSAAVLTMLSAFVAMLTVLTVGDLVDGHVGPARLATHGVLVVGYLLVLRLARRAPTLDGAAARAPTGEIRRIGGAAPAAAPGRARSGARNRVA